MGKGSLYVFVHLCVWERGGEAGAHSLDSNTKSVVLSEEKYVMLNISVLVISKIAESCIQI